MPIINFITILCFSLLLIFSISLIANTSIIAILTQLSKAFYIPDKNLFETNDIAGINVYIYFYGILVLTALTTSLLTKLKVIRCNRPIYLSSLITLLLLVGFQTIHHTQSFYQQHKQFTKKSMKEKISVRMKNAYHFAQYCRTHLPGEHIGRTITDKNLRETQSMFTFFAVAYYLYPIDIRIDTNYPEDCLIVFLKKNPLKAIPNNFTPMKNFDIKSLIAIKNKNK